MGYCNSPQGIKWGNNLEKVSALKKGFLLKARCVGRNRRTEEGGVCVCVCGPEERADGGAQIHVVSSETTKIHS